MSLHLVWCQKQDDFLGFDKVSVLLLVTYHKSVSVIALKTCNSTMLRIVWIDISDADISIYVLIIVSKQNIMIQMNRH